MPNDEDLPDVSELRDVGRNHMAYRSTRGWLNEAFALCMAAFGLGAFGDIQSSIQSGSPTNPGLIASVAFALAIGAVVASWRTLGPQSSYPDKKRRSLRVRLILAAVAAGIPFLVAVIARTIQFASLITESSG